MSNKKDILIKSQQGELDAVLMYNALAAAVEKDGHTVDAKTFRKLAAEEGRHASVFHKLTGVNIKPQKTKAVMLPILYKILGRRRLYPLIAKGEYAAVRTYAPVAEKYPSVISVRKDEKRHGDIVKALLER